MYKTRTRADLLRGLADNQGLANDLAEYQTRYGDWRELFLQLDKVDKVTKADIRRVANKIFIESNRTEAWTETDAPTAAPQALRRKTEVRNEQASLEEHFQIRRCFRSLRGVDRAHLASRSAGQTLGEDSHPQAARVQTSSADSHRAQERNCSFLAGGSRVAIRLRIGAHSRRFAR